MPDRSAISASLANSRCASDGTVIACAAWIQVLNSVSVVNHIRSPARANTGRAGHGVCMRLSLSCAICCFLARACPINLFLLYHLHNAKLISLHLMIQSIRFALCCVLCGPTISGVFGSV